MYKYTILFFTGTLVINGICGGGVDEIINVSREEFDNLRATVNRLESFAENQISLNKRLESDLDKQREVIHNLQDVISQQGDKIRRLEELSRHEEEVKSRRHSIVNRSVKSSSKIRRYADNTVGFFATLTQLSLAHLGAHQNIVFDDIVTNVGNAYNNHQGVFIAPVSGLYLITTSILSGPNKEIWADIVVNGTEIVRLNGRGTDGRHGNGAQTVVIALKKGDDVSVQNVRTDDDYWGDKYSSFGGFLIQEFEMDSSSIVG
ncbi:heavy metal-binding protein HIP-like [Mercenaria mercenaria]|uniref:heavy metal-binding protein HIP-like n=1 Tax=Mercenaria mercenaria TaxID=6596 RepID=UPI001E1D9E32|nr:heavy metal-binding protein HIP-like [Mercenaria mercenaria]